MRFAYLVCFELRCLKEIDKLYKYIIDYYDADIFICVQETPDVEEKIKLFNRKVIKKKVYKRIENPKINYFHNPELDIHGKGNFRKEPILNFYINLIEMGEFIKDHINNYDYFIILRTDIDILFKFPPKKLFEKVLPSIYTFNAQYCRKWGGFGSGIFIHKKYIYKSLTCFKNILQDNNLIKNYYKEANFRVPNQETFSNYCYKINNFEFKYINNLNFWFIVDINSKEEMIKFNKDRKQGKQNARVQILYCKKRKIFFKYKAQVVEAYHNQKLNQDDYKWILDENQNILLSK